MRERISRFVAYAAAGAATALMGVLLVRPARPPAAPLRSVGYAAPVRGDRIDLPGLAGVVELDNGTAPTFLHFYNPGGSDAEESIAHLAELMASNRDGARFVAVVEATAANVERAHRQLARLGVPVVPDPGARIARACGVRTTPGAVILDAQGRMFFRGGYGDGPVGRGAQARAGGGAADADGATSDPYAGHAAGSGIESATASDDGP